MSLAWPWIFLALPLPWLLRRLLPPLDAGLALRLPRLPEVPSAGTARGASPLWISALAWLLLLLAAARPQAPGEPVMQAVHGRELMLALDVSASMATRDLLLDGQAAGRLQAARRFAGDFIRRREGDRIGLVVFGTQAYLHTPLTFDLQAVRSALDGAETGLAGRETALGDAIALATKRLRTARGEDRVLVLLTDGANTAGTLAPLRAAWLAQRENVRVHVVGIGPPAGLDEATLRGIADQTGGIYLRATDGAAIASFFREIDRIEAVKLDPLALTPVRELYPWPLSLALALAAWLALRRARGAGA